MQFYGWMNWPTDADWRCVTCGSERNLLWGLQHGTCACATCHTQYRMLDEGGTRVTVPICMLKPEYKEPARIAWERWELAVDKVSAEQWVEAGVPKEVFA